MKFLPWVTAIVLVSTTVARADEVPANDASEAVTASAQTIAANEVTVDSRNAIASKSLEEVELEEAPEFSTHETQPVAVNDRPERARRDGRDGERRGARGARGERRGSDMQRTRARAAGRRGDGERDADRPRRGPQRDRRDAIDGPARNARPDRSGYRGNRMRSMRMAWMRSGNPWARGFAGPPWARGERDRRPGNVARAAGDFSRGPRGMRLERDGERRERNPRFARDARGSRNMQIAQGNQRRGPEASRGRENRGRGERGRAERGNRDGNRRPERGGPRDGRRRGDGQRSPEVRRETQQEVRELRREVEALRDMIERLSQEA